MEMSADYTVSMYIIYHSSIIRYTLHSIPAIRLYNFVTVLN